MIDKYKQITTDTMKQTKLNIISALLFVAAMAIETSAWAQDFSSASSATVSSSILANWAHCAASRTMSKRLFPDKTAA